MHFCLRYVQCYIVFPASHIRAFGWYKFEEVAARQSTLKMLRVGALCAVSSEECRVSDVPVCHRTSKCWMRNCCHVQDSVEHDSATSSTTDDTSTIDKVQSLFLHSTLSVSDFNLCHLHLLNLWISYKETLVDDCFVVFNYIFCHTQLCICPSHSGIESKIIISRSHSFHRRVTHLVLKFFSSKFHILG